MLKHACLFCLVTFASLSVSANTGVNSTVTQVVATPVTQQTIVNSLEALGTLHARESVALSSTVTERVASIHFNDGDTVKKGQVLVRLVSLEEQASLAELKIATEDAQRQYERFVPLFRRGDVSQSILDERKREWDLARAKEQVVQARLDKLTLVAPFSGRVGLRQISVGALLTPGTVVTSLVDMSEVKLDFSLPSRFLSELSIGHKVEVTTDAYPGEVFVGEVETLLSQVDVTTRSVQVRAKLDNSSEKLLPGMLMKVSLQQTPRAALFVPETAIVPVAEKQFVYVLNPHENGLFKLVRKQVKLGSRQPGLVEVVSGLKMGERVVSQGALRVRPGAIVQALDNVKRLSDFADQGESK